MDAKLAENIRKAARELCRHLNAAGEAGLQIDFKVAPMMSKWGGAVPIRMNWQPFITITRIVEV